jgi:hypothetical protein
VEDLAASLEKDLTDIANCTKIPSSLQQAVKILETGETYASNLIDTINALAQDALDNCTKLETNDQPACISADVAKMKKAVTTFQFEAKIFKQLVTNMYNLLVKEMKACFNIDTARNIVNQFFSSLFRH